MSCIHFSLSAGLSTYTGNKVLALLQREGISLATKGISLARKGILMTYTGKVLALLERAFS